MDRWSFSQSGLGVGAEPKEEGVLGTVPGRPAAGGVRVPGRGCTKFGCSFRLFSFVGYAFESLKLSYSSRVLPSHSVPSNSSAMWHWERDHIFALEIW